VNPGELQTAGQRLAALLPPALMRKVGQARTYQHLITYQPFCSTSLMKASISVTTSCVRATCPRSV
jgi:hypothetical protein